jgi:hypothetical protein
MMRDAQRLGFILMLTGVLVFPGALRAQSSAAPPADGATPAPVPAPATTSDPQSTPPNPAAAANSATPGASADSATPAAPGEATTPAANSTAPTSATQASATQASATQASTTPASTTPASGTVVDPVTAAAAADAQDAAKGNPAGSVVHHLAADVSITLGPSWQEFDIGAMPPPTALASYAPPFHLNALLALQNAKNISVLQIATSSNPLIGHDSNWLDSEMHKPSGSGMSVLDLLFYYFAPPTRECIEQVLTQDPKATFAPVPNSGSNNNPSGGAGGSSSDGSGSPVLQVSLACKAPATMMGFFQAQLSGGITFAQTNGGPRAFATIKQFYLAPMERVSIGGMTWFIFEAQRVDPVGPNASTNYNLGGNYQGAQSDYFWAIGAIVPFPFVKDSPRGNQPLIHVAYASVGANGNKHAEFMTLLQRVQVRGSNAGQ